MAAPVKERTSAPEYDDFEITPLMAAWFKEHCRGTSRRVMLGQTRRFLKFHAFREHRMFDWAAAWRRWMFDAHATPSRKLKDQP